MATTLRAVEANQADEALRRATGKPAPIKPKTYAPDTTEALRQVIARQIGPRRPGTVYRNIDGEFRVLDVITDPSEARRILKRRAAQFAVLVVDTLRPGAEPFVVGTTWTGSDLVLKAVAA